MRCFVEKLFLSCAEVPICASALGGVFFFYLRSRLLDFVV